MTDIPQPPPADTTRQEEWSETIRIFILAIVIAICVRSFLFEPFTIPSGSMLPDLQIGDFIFVSKFSYGYSRYSLPFGLPLFEGRVLQQEPTRGDVIVFKLPRDPSIDYIKRLIGLPGDRIQMKSGELYINDVKVPREEIGALEIPRSSEDDKVPVIEYSEHLPQGATHVIVKQGNDMPLDNTPVFVVPPGHYFFMGDNRDNSQDSRTQTVGYVPAENLVGRADLVFFSLDNAKFWQVWKWPWAIRYDRLFTRIH